MWKDFKTFIPKLDWNRARKLEEPLELAEEILDFLRGKVTEWNPASFTATGFLEGLGIRVHPMEYRFAAVVSQLSRWLEWAPIAVKPLIFLGSAHTGHEVLMFQKHLSKLMAAVAILVTPSGITGEFVSNQLRTQHFWVDSSMMGDVLGGCWDVLLRTRNPMKLTIAPNLVDGWICLAEI